MAIAFFPSLAQAEIVDVSFSQRQGGETILRLLVDSGFTGQSSFVLSKDALDLALMPAPPLAATGAIQGIQQRALAFYHVSVLGVDATAIAILADLSAMALPPGVDGIAGLQFLRQFRRWGAEKSDNGSWRFFLETGST
jgi:predicted aspartyl protease